MTGSVGIDKISFYTPSYYIDIEEFARGRGLEVDKCKIGLGQEQMAIIPPKEDIVTMAAEAANDILTDEDREQIELVLFATESGVDFSKSAGIYLHKLLRLRPNCRVLEVKQACYAATGSLQLACDYVRVNGHKKSLVISSDIAWYGFESVGEVTQGCGAVAMLVSAQPRICSVGKGEVFVEDIGDFYRPSFSKVPMVNGKLSIKTYQETLGKTLKGDTYKYCCFHMPFSTMADKANKVLGHGRISERNLALAKQYGKSVGNIYNGSLYLSFISLMLNEKEDLAGEEIGMFSYGSGAIGEFFSVKMQKGYKEGMNSALIHKRISSRTAVKMEEYEQLWHIFLEKESAEHFIPPAGFDSPTSKFTLEKIEDGHRYYGVCDEH